MYTRSDADWLLLLKKAPSGIIPGDPVTILEQSQKIFQILRDRSMVKSGDRVLDLGCGIGRMGIPLSTMDVHYTGIDIVPACIEFCRNTFSPWSHFVFKVLNIRNSKYREKGFWSPRRMRLPCRAGSFDTALAISLFTHIGDPVARDRYLSELHRVLSDEGHLLITWFRSPPNAVSHEDERTVFPEKEIRESLRGFEIVDNWGGTTTEYHDQWVMHLKKKPLR